jgi:hypothetical protein
MITLPRLVINDAIPIFFQVFRRILRASPSGEADQVLAMEGSIPKRLSDVE